MSLLHVGTTPEETVDFSTYGFLYGTFPSAPTVFVFATQYALDVDLVSIKFWTKSLNLKSYYLQIASAMVACTFISAPLMFVSAKMITLSKTDPSQYIKQLNAFTFDISIVGLIVCVWLVFVYAITKKINRLPHKITACLVVAQVSLMV